MINTHSNILKFNTILFSIFFLSLSLFAGRKAEDEFWSEDNNREKGANSGISAHPGESFVQAGLLGYINYGKGKDEFTAGLKISSSFREAFDFMFLRMDGFLAIDGPVEGTGEVQFALIKGLNCGLGINYSERIKFSPRFGLYVEDQNNFSKRAGFYLLKDSSGGIEINWPFGEQWDAFVDVGVEKNNIDSYKRLVAGLMYKF
jgi:hypothetical protein